MHRTARRRLVAARTVDAHDQTATIRRSGVGHHARALGNIVFVPPAETPAQPGLNNHFKAKLVELARIVGGERHAHGVGLSGEENRHEKALLIEPENKRRNGNLPPSLRPPYSGLFINPRIVSAEAQSRKTICTSAAPGSVPSAASASNAAVLETIPTTSPTSFRTGAPELPPP